jgi:hypothetical protein
MRVEKRALLANRSFAWWLAANGRLEAESNFSDQGIFRALSLG